MASGFPAPLVVDAKGRHTATVILSHGMGGTAASWVERVAAWRENSGLDGVKWVLPNSPTMAITANEGAPMTAWFDINHFDGSAAALLDEPCVDDILAGTDYIQGLVRGELAAGVAAARIVVGGFSQGGVVSAFAGLTLAQPLGGVVLLSAWLPRAAAFRGLLPGGGAPANAATPVLMAHGIDDRMVPPAVGKRSFDELAAAGFGGVRWEVYPGLGHGTCADELEDVELFIEERLGSGGEAGVEG